MLEIAELWIRAGNFSRLLQTGSRFLGLQLAVDLSEVKNRLQSVLVELGHLRVSFVVVVGDDDSVVLNQSCYPTF